MNRTVDVVSKVRPLRERIVALGSRTGSEAVIKIFDYLVGITLVRIGGLENNE